MSYAEVVSVIENSMGGLKLLLHECFGIGTFLSNTSICRHEQINEQEMSSRKIEELFFNGILLKTAIIITGHLVFAL